MNTTGLNFDKLVFQSINLHTGDTVVMDRRDKDIQRGKDSPNYLRYAEFMPV